MIINVYDICTKMTSALKSTVINENETNPVQKYCNDNFNSNTKIYNQIAVNKSSYTLPYIAIHAIGQVQKSDETIQIDIDFAIPQEEIQEIETDGVIEYENYYKLSELATLILQTIEKKTKHTICNTVTQRLFRPNEIEIGANYYKGTIQYTYAIAVSLNS